MTQEQIWRDLVEVTAPEIEVFLKKLAAAG
jgi:hypothetical protein